MWVGHIQVYALYQSRFIVTLAQEDAPAHLCDVVHKKSRLQDRATSRQQLVSPNCRPLSASVQQQNDHEWVQKNELAPTNMPLVAVAIERIRTSRAVFVLDFDPLIGYLDNTIVNGNLREIAKIRHRRGAVDHKNLASESGRPHATKNLTCDYDGPLRGKSHRSSWICPRSTEILWVGDEVQHELVRELQRGYALLPPHSQGKIHGILFD